MSIFDQVTTTSGSTTLAPWHMDGGNLAQINSDLTGLLETPWQTWGGDWVADMNAQQDAGLGGMFDYSAGPAQDLADFYGSTGRGLTGGLQGAQDFYKGAMNWEPITNEGPDMAQVAMMADNPYMTGMIDAVGRDVSRNLYENQMPGIAAYSAGSGNMGSSRRGMQEGIAERGAADRLADISSTMRGSAYQNAMNLESSRSNQNANLAANNRLAQLSAAGGSAGLGQYGVGLMNMGDQRYRQAYGDMTGVGDRYQAQSQAEIDAQREKFLQDQLLPMQQLTAATNITLPQEQIFGTRTSEGTRTEEFSDELLFAQALRGLPWDDILGGGGGGSGIGDIFGDLFGDIGGGLGDIFGGIFGGIFGDDGGDGGGETPGTEGSGSGETTTADPNANPGTGETTTPTIPPSTVVPPANDPPADIPPADVPPATVTPPADIPPAYVPPVTVTPPVSTPDPTAPLPDETGVNTGIVTTTPAGPVETSTPPVAVGPLPNFVPSYEEPTAPRPDETGGRTTPGDDPAEIFYPGDPNFEEERNGPTYGDGPPGTIGGGGGGGVSIPTGGGPTIPESFPTGGGGGGGGAGSPTSPSSPGTGAPASTPSGSQDGNTFNSLWGTEYEKGTQGVPFAEQFWADTTHTGGYSESEGAEFADSVVDVYEATYARKIGEGATEDVARYMAAKEASSYANKRTEADGVELGNHLQVDEDAPKPSIEYNPAFGINMPDINFDFLDGIDFNIGDALANLDIGGDWAFQGSPWGSGGFGIPSFDIQETWDTGSLNLLN